MLAGTNYSLLVERNDGAIRNFTSETISSLSTNVFRTKSTALYLPSSLPAANPNSYGFDFEDICGDINLLKGQILARVYGNKVYGTGFYNGNDGKVVNNNNFQIRYAVSFTAGDSEYFARYTRP